MTSNYWEDYGLDKFIARAQTVKAGIGAVCSLCNKMIGTMENREKFNLCQHEEISYQDKLKAHGLYEYYKDMGQPAMTSMNQYKDHG